ncbi:interferon phi 4 [Myripristis murdjan]|uniref:interferon phi 4 n=1 Tax=Myripristis murdjan TaxID=586833 RepID=UPI001175F466|nr:interferon a3-like [Myripristis murdjan]
MFNRIFALCLCLTLCGQGLSLGCRWMDHKFSQQSKSALDELRTMGGNYTQNSSGVDFPTGLYEQASQASAEDRLNFMAQVLEEVVHLFEEDWDSMPWPETTVNNFLSVVNQQEEGVRSCIVNQGKKSKKLHMYFKRLSRHVLKDMGHSSEAWELMRKEIEAHLLRIDILAASV